jgi:hypothetical protein
MIRHVIMVQFKPDATEEQKRLLEMAWGDFRTRYDGLLGLTFGRDAGLRDGNMTMLAVFDFVDEAAFRAFDTDPHHNEIRAQLPAHGVEQAVRCQIRP